MAARRFVAVAACLPALALAACGSGSSLTKAQYDAKVNRLCLVAADQVREMHLTNTIGDWRHYATTMARIGVHFDGALAALKPPSSIANEAAVFLEANKKALADDRDAIAAARAGDTARFHAAVNQGKTDNLATHPSAKAIGATGCYIP